MFLPQGPSFAAVWVVFATLLCCASAFGKSDQAAAEAPAIQEATSAERGLFGWVGTTSGAGPQPFGPHGGPGAGVHVGLSYRLHWVEPEAIVETGFFGKNYHQRFAFGARFILPFPDFRPFLWAAFNHTHETAFANFIRAPVQSFLSSTAAGTAHLSGGEVGVGMLIPIDVLVQPHRKQRYDVLVRATVAALPAVLAMMAGHGMDRYYFFFEVSAAIPFFQVP